MDPLLSDNEKELLLQYKEKKERLRQKAIAEEFTRLNKQMHKKNKIITLQRVVVALMMIGAVLLISFTIPMNQFFSGNSEKTVKVIPKSTLPKDTASKTSIPPKPKKKYFQVHFKNLPNYPLAQFISLETANNFCYQLTKMEFPQVTITKHATSAKRTTTDTLKQSIVSKYAVQIGAYDHDFLKNYHSKLIWLNYHYEEGLHKYRITPFDGFSKSKAFAAKLEGNDYYIVRNK
ncbi:MAG: hypothetical protein ACEPOZ_03350 [Marinifilaceae bacterium]